MADRVHILVLNHNGRALLEECLPSVVAAARGASSKCRVTVIDNDSSDDSVAWLERTWPEVGIVRAANRGLVSFNEVVRWLQEPIVLLLNNDVKLAHGCVDCLKRTFERHADCFIAGPLCWTFDGCYEGTHSDLCFRRGLVHTRLNPDGVAVSSGVVNYTASAGAVLAVSREKFLALGGFDPLFLPGRYEDLDLAFRGWLAGWNAYFVPDAIAYHKGSATFDECFGRPALNSLDVRNALLFAWKHLREPRHVGLHLAFLMLRVLRAVATGQRDFLAGLADAMSRLPDALARRAATSTRIRSERELFRMLGADRNIRHGTT
jgi:GT2 family glycosyltransferase